MTAKGLSQSQLLASSSFLSIRQLSSTSASRAQPRSSVSPSSSSSLAQSSSPDAANPPATTRPPPLELPERTPDTSTFSFLFATGKAYLSFYKTGLKNVFHNRQLLQAAAASSPGPPATRSHHQLQARARHDLRCLPVFGLLLLVCGEFTPFVVLAVPSLTPFTCRIPAQTTKMQRAAEARRQRSFADLAAAVQNSADAGAAHATAAPATLSAAVKTGHLARTLGVVGSVWDRVGPWAPLWFSRRRVDAKLVFLARDDELLARAGGVGALEEAEVRLACAERGIDVLDRSAEELRRALGAWLRLTRGSGGASQSQEPRHQMELLLTRPEDKWPAAGP